ncbi:MAG TPA: CoA transferase [Dehalococcoidia bacterium]|nr:CoA transferase [Dehalococcoidia bacterium]
MQREAIERAARSAGLELAAETEVTVEGDDPVLASPFHLGEGAATALALLGQEASRIWVERGGKSQSLSIDIRHAAASLFSYALLRLDGASPVRPQNNDPPVTWIWHCADDRYILLHGSFNDSPGIVEELGLDMTAGADDIRAAVKIRSSQELEDALAAKGLCNAICRTNEEWLAHPQGALLATKPVVEVTKVSDAPAEPFAEGERPLSGIRVLDLTRVLAGPTCARTLAEHGADVLHIASPNLPTFEGFEMDTGHGKRQAYIDLNEPREAETLRELIRGADVFSQGFQHRTLERRGFGVEQVAELRPGIIYVSENAFGHEGPWQERPGWEQLAQATTGVTIVQGGEGRPNLAPAAMNDYTTGYFAALGAMMALRRRAAEGGSWLVRVSLSQTSMWYYRLGHDLDASAAPEPLDASDYLEERSTGYGRITHLRPPLRMSETQPRWELPTAPLGRGSAAWN